MSHGKSQRRNHTRQRPIAVARVSERMPMHAVNALLGLLIVILVLGKSGVVV
jgi:hypothetical protein